MSQPSDELLYSLIISQLKDDGFYEEADSLQRKVVNAVFNIEASRQLRRIVEIMSVTNGMSWRKLTTNSQCPQGVILNLKSGSDSTSPRDVAESGEPKYQTTIEDQSFIREQRQPLEPRIHTAGYNTAEQRIGDMREQNHRVANEVTPETPDQESPKDDMDGEHKWKKEMEHMRFDFKLSRKVDFKIHNIDPSKKRVLVDEKMAKRMKGPSTSQGKFFHIKMNKDFQPEEKKMMIQNQAAPSTSSSGGLIPPQTRQQDDGGDGKGNLQDFLQKITIPMDKLN